MPRAALLALVLLAPLAFGAAPAWGWAPLALGAGLLLLAAVPEVAAGRAVGPLRGFGAPAVALATVPCAVAL
jgi:hypothetical protein